MRTTRVFELASRLAAATGAEARIHRLPGGTFRIEATLPGEPDDHDHLAVLHVLGQADRFGHSYTDRTHTVWAEFDPPQEPP
ncbi:hypothetical protein [Streptomyces sp. TLI_171]|uniref:hypothetical protein n=1 Tax=Streptomyces sp. TLI_171 TaxID=1938859 RepID=UPI000C500264|nr:hypothetical protein [Streptomyces sp. TLI_171]RKE21324.1 hypothetical protein BX266_4709 [Streptomyces sp. TLI_171]